jgi:hypothetical protein
MPARTGPNPERVYRAEWRQRANRHHGNRQETELSEHPPVPKPHTSIHGNLSLARIGPTEQRGSVWPAPPLGPRPSHSAYCANYAFIWLMLWGRAGSGVLWQVRTAICGQCCARLLAGRRGFLWGYVGSNRRHRWGNLADVLREQLNEGSHARPVVRAFVAADVCHGLPGGGPQNTHTRKARRLFASACGTGTFYAPLLQESPWAHGRLGWGLWGSGGALPRACGTFLEGRLCGNWCRTMILPEDQTCESYGAPTEASQHGIPPGTAAGACGESVAAAGGVLGEAAGGSGTRTLLLREQLNERPHARPVVRPFVAAGTVTG